MRDTFFLFLGENLSAGEGDFVLSWFRQATYRGGGILLTAPTDQLVVVKSCRGSQLQLYSISP